MTLRPLRHHSTPQRGLIAQNARPHRHVGTNPASGISRSHLPASSTNESHLKTSYSVVSTAAFTPSAPSAPSSGRLLSTAASSPWLRMKTCTAHRCMRSTTLDHCESEFAGRMQECRIWEHPASKSARAGQGCAPCGSTGSKSGESVTCGCSCCFSTQWYTSQRSIHLQLMQMHERGASSRRRKIDSRGEYCVGAVRLNDSDACAPMRISRSVGILWFVE